MTPLTNNTAFLTRLLQAIITSLSIIFAPLAIAEWSFNSFKPATTSKDQIAHLDKAQMSIEFKGSALTFFIEENLENGEINWQGIFSSRHPIKSLKSIQTTNINPFDNSKNIVLQISNPRSALTVDGRSAIVFDMNATDAQALSQSKDKLLVVNYESRKKAVQRSLS